VDRTATVLKERATGSRRYAQTQQVLGSVDVPKLEIVDCHTQETRYPGDISVCEVYESFLLATFGATSLTFKTHWVR
jgi:hypothetical protein